MDNGRNGGFFLFGLVAVLVLYYGFHMDGLAWILKTAFAGVILFIALAIGATVYLIWYSTKKRKEKMAERDRKKAEKAGQAVHDARPAGGIGIQLFFNFGQFPFDQCAFDHRPVQIFQGNVAAIEGG